MHWHQNSWTSAHAWERGAPPTGAPYLPPGLQAGCLPLQQPPPPGQAPAAPSTVARARSPSCCSWGRETQALLASRAGPRATEAWQRACQAPLQGRRREARPSAVRSGQAVYDAATRSRRAGQLQGSAWRVPCCSQSGLEDTSGILSLLQPQEEGHRVPRPRRLAPGARPAVLGLHAQRAGPTSPGPSSLWPVTPSPLLRAITRRTAPLVSRAQSRHAVGPGGRPCVPRNGCRRRPVTVRLKTHRGPFGTLPRGSWEKRQRLPAPWAEGRSATRCPRGARGGRDSRGRTRKDRVSLEGPCRGPESGRRSERGAQGPAGQTRPCWWEVGCRGTGHSAGQGKAGDPR